MFMKLRSFMVTAQRRLFMTFKLLRAGNFKELIARVPTKIPGLNKIVGRSKRKYLRNKYQSLISEHINHNNSHLCWGGAK